MKENYEYQNFTTESNQDEEPLASQSKRNQETSKLTKPESTLIDSTSDCK